MPVSLRSERLLHQCRRILRLARRLVPADRRADWEMEWVGELWYRIEQADGWSGTPAVRRRMLRATLGAVLHAAWLRALEWRLRMQDIRYGLRLIARQPGVSVVVVLTLALGIGANAAMFTIVNAVLLRPLPYTQPERLVWMYGSFALNDSAAISPPDFLDYRARNRVFSSMGAMAIGTGSVNLSRSGAAERVGESRVSAELFSTLGITPVLGRGFRPEEERAGAAPVVVLGYELWRDRFNRDAGVIGRTVLVDAEPTTVIGVMPPGFRLPFDSGIGMASEAALWRPLAFGSPEMSVRRFHFLRAIGRLKDGVALEQAQASLDVVARQLEAAYRENESWKLRLVSLQENMVGPVRSALWLLQAVVGLVLLVACGNVTSLLLARAEARQEEVAIRASLGASRGRLLRQLLTESLVLASVGAGIGLAVAYWGVRAVTAVVLAGLPRGDEISLDPSVLLFAAGMTIVTTLACGLAPALRLSSERIVDGIRTRRSSRDAAGGRFQRALVVGQITASVVLLVAAGLLMRSLWRMQSVPLGFDADGAIAGRIALPAATYPDEDRERTFIYALLDRLRSEPGIERVSAINILPLSGGSDTAVHVDGIPPASDRERRFAQIRSVAGDFFGTMRMPFVAGHSFDDRHPDAARHSIVINRHMADEFFPSQNPIGRHLVVDIGQPASLEVTGVVGDIREWGPAGPAPSIMYLSSQLNVSPQVSVVVRVADSAPALGATLERVVRGLDRDLAVSQVQPMSERVAARMAQPRLRALSLAAFATVALGLTLVGLYGALAYAVARRNREIGIRLALGANPSEVRRMMIRQGTALVGIGLALGAIAALGAARLMGSVLLEVQPRDPLVFATVTLTILTGGLLASLLPAIRAARVEPLVALRSE